MTEQEIINVIRQYEYVPKEILERLFCSSPYDYVNKKNIRYLERKLKQLVQNRCIDYQTDGDAYCVPVFSGKINHELLKALWVLTQFDNVTRHFAGTDFVNIIFTADDNALYEIISLSSKTYRMVTAAINRNTDKKNMPKRIVMVDSEDEANCIGNSILKEINCVALCTVCIDGKIESYDI